MRVLSVLTVLLAIALAAFALTGCGSDDDEDPATR